MNQVTAEEAKAAIQGMTANYGTWSIDEATKTLTTNIEGSSSPNLNGGTQFDRGLGSYETIRGA